MSGFKTREREREREREKRHSRKKEKKKDESDKKLNAKLKGQQFTDGSNFQAKEAKLSRVWTPRNLSRLKTEQSTKQKIETINLLTDN